MERQSRFHSWGCWHADEAGCDVGDQEVAISAWLSLQTELIKFEQYPSKAEPSHMGSISTMPRADRSDVGMNNLAVVRSAGRGLFSRPTHRRACRPTDRNSRIRARPSLRAAPCSWPFHPRALREAQLQVVGTFVAVGNERVPSQ